MPLKSHLILRNGCLLTRAIAIDIGHVGNSIFYGRTSLAHSVTHSKASLPLERNLKGWPVLPHVTSMGYEKCSLFPVSV